jgi:hypothetical protein
MSKGGVDVSGSSEGASKFKSGQADEVPGRWNHLLSTEILEFQHFSASSHAGLQKPTKGLADAQQDDICKVRESEFRWPRSLGVCGKSQFI